MAATFGGVRWLGGRGLWCVAGTELIVRALPNKKGPALRRAVSATPVCNRSGTVHCAEAQSAWMPNSFTSLA
ncbi:hypothetical protein GCM10009080_28850 [Cupriavidus pauculus]